ncbi:MAG: lipid II flippase MurJ, partial [Candidatus Parvarchaeum sp.]
IVIFYLLFSGILVRILFFYGHFTRTDLKLTKIATMIYAINIPVMLIWPLIYRVYQIRDNLKPVFFVAVIGIIINGLLNYIFVLKFMLGIAGIALGSVCAGFLMSILGYLILKTSKTKLLMEGLL